ncbi:MAG: hypothetical protein K1Y02_03215 [Candidatus Hydrogenedentes bacterium]|nr:hypothetical protein [Candidatus Hydrogenedentota bacterium]
MPRHNVWIAASICLAFALGGRADTPATQAANSGPAPTTSVTSIIELQPHREVHTLANARGDQVSIINLNTHIGAYYLLQGSIAGEKFSLHLEVPVSTPGRIERPALTLVSEGIVVTEPRGTVHSYLLWPNAMTHTSPFVLEVTPAGTAPNRLCDTPVIGDILRGALRASSAFTSICDGHVLVRTQKTGSATLLESTTDFLRQASIGDWLLEQAKPYLIPAPELVSDHAAVAQPLPTRGPRSALVDPSHAETACVATSVGVAIDAAEHGMVYGKWYAAQRHPGIFVSVIKASVIDTQILESYKDRVARLGSQDAREADALVYLLAFDTMQYRFGFSMGAEHPGLGWSPYIKTAHDTQGPDGFSSRKPLVTIGAVPPYEEPYVTATFTGGFKRQHGAFKSGALSQVNNGSHFGFVEKGVIFSRVMPGLATAAIKQDGQIDLYTWPQDSSFLSPVLYDVRQNCVAIVDGVDANGLTIPGELVNKWGEGAWSGSQTGQFTTTRTGLAIQDSEHASFILFAYFTGATPNAMARVFQAYQCRYAMLLDMNSFSACFATLYDRDAQRNVTDVEYLHKEMASVGGKLGRLRFLETDDTRDFFYVMRKPDQGRVAKR